MLFSGGGTGGHVYPILTIIEELRASGATTELLYLGGRDSFEERLCARQGIPFRAISAGQIRGMSPLAVIGSGLRLLVGFFQSLRQIAGFRPEATLVTGGYISAPVALASWLWRCPVLIYLPDIEPGLAVRALARFARRVAVSFAESLSYFRPGKAVVTGYPVRAAFFQTDKGKARAQLGLADDQPVLLAMGGSRGAQSINTAIAGNLSALVKAAQIVHITGAEDIERMKEAQRRLPAELQSRYHPYGYLHDELIAAMVAADLVIARAGAATLAEFPAAGLPAILAPYPYSGQHQEANADYLVRHGAAVKLSDGDMRHGLTPLVDKLLSDTQALNEMAASARRLAHPEAARNIAALMRQWEAQK